MTLRHSSSTISPCSASQADTAAPVCRRLAQDCDFLHDFFERSDLVSGFFANTIANLPTQEAQISTARTTG